MSGGHQPQSQLHSGSGFESAAILSPQVKFEQKMGFLIKYYFNFKFKVGLQLGSNKALLTQSYNSPMGLYSNQNIADTLASTVKKLVLVLFKSMLCFV